jgi:hypothetical protein
MQENKTLDFDVFWFVQFQCILQNIFCWNPKFTKYHHYSIVPNKFHNVVFNHSPLCLKKKSDKSFSSTSMPILTVVFTNSIPKWCWSLANTYCGILWNMKKIVAELPFLVYNKVIHLLAFRDGTSLQNIDNSLLWHFANNVRVAAFTIRKHRQ